MNRWRPLLGLLAALFLLAAPARAGEREIRDRLENLRTSMADISALSGDFVQEKKLAFLTEPLVSSGRFYFARPNFLRWEYLSPNPVGLEIQGHRVNGWSGPPDHRQKQPQAMAEAGAVVAGQVMMWMNLDPKAILAAYELSILHEAPLILKVVPRRGAAKQYLEHLTVEFNSDGRTVREVVVKEPEARTSLTFSRVALNPPPLPR